MVANNGVLSTRNFMLPAGGTTLNVPIGDNWGAGAYAMVEAFRTSNATQTPTARSG